MVLVERASVPPLPPTSNTLTRVERAHRRRSANKVGQVLGIRPQVMDLGSATMADRYWSMTTAMISSHVSLPALPYSTSVECEDKRYSSTDAIFLSGEESKRTTKSTKLHPPPLLHVGRSNHFHPLSKFKTHYFDHAPAGLGFGEADDNSLPELCASSSSEEGDIPDPPSPTLSVPSTIAMRRRKMERLQRILGEDVPLTMVFPENRTDTSRVARDDMVRTPSRKLRSMRRRRPQSAPSGSACSFPTGALEKPLSKNSITETNAPAPRADECLESEKSVASPAQEFVPVSRRATVLQKKRRKRPVTPHPHHRPPSFFQNSQPSESEQPATPPAQESVLVAPVLQKTPEKRPFTPPSHYRPQSFFQNSNKTQPATTAKYSYIYYPTLPLCNSNISCGDEKTAQIMEFGEAKCLRTIIESPAELESILAQDSGGLCSDEGQEDCSSSRTSSSGVSLTSDWGSASTAIHVGDRSGAAAVKHDESQNPDAGPGEQVRHVWRHKRKPPPVYEP
ncbi:hypothetical protein APHAL10511_000529 [Amanita phalloides]|nr:hypothetical protein APHAL10511_000529 [Amanita phalloides]